jgi:serine/threonine protein kinase
MLTFTRKIYKGENRRVYEGIYFDTRCFVKILTSSSPHQKSLFEEEYRILTHISHPKLPKILGFEETDLGPAMILSYLEGQTLRKLIDSKETHKISFETLYSQLTKIIREIHQLKSIKDSKPLNIIHRDIKPSNIIIHIPTQEVFVCDLGIAYYDHPDRLTHSSPEQRKASILYCAPEYLREGSKGKEQDYFSIGWILVELLIEKKPPGFIPNSTKYNSTRKRYIDALPQQYQRYIKGLTEFYPQDRYIIPMEIPTSKPKPLYIIALVVFVLSVFFFIFLLTNTNILR